MATKPKTRSSRKSASLDEIGDRDSSRKSNLRSSVKKTKSTTKWTKKNIELPDDEPVEMELPFENSKPTAEEQIEAEATKYFSYGRNKDISVAKRKKKAKDNEETIRRIPQLSMDALAESFKDDGVLAEKMKKKHANSFHRWMLYLAEGANLLLAGYGSKLDLLDEFRRRQLVVNSYTHIVLHGYRSDVSVKQLLITLQNSFKLEISEKMKSGRHGLVQRAREISDAIKKLSDSTDFVILIHSIDGLALRDEESQTALSYLAEIPTCRILASVDHVNASLLWDKTLSNRFKWMWIDATTYANYQREIEGQGSKILGISKKAGNNEACHTLDGLKNIWSSLSTNAQAVFSKLAKSQLTKVRGGGRNANLMTSLELFASCRNDFVVSSEAQLKQMLTEFEDHNLLKTKFNMDEQEVLYVNVQKDLLVEFLSATGIEIDQADQANGNDSSANDKADHSTDDDGGDENDTKSASSDGTESDDGNDSDAVSEDALSDLSVTY